MRTPYVGGDGGSTARQDEIAAAMTITTTTTRTNVTEADFLKSKSASYASRLYLIQRCVENNWFIYRAQSN